MFICSPITIIDESQRLLGIADEARKSLHTGAWLILPILVIRSVFGA
jgi:hypothetical protein